MGDAAHVARVSRDIAIGSLTPSLATSWGHRDGIDHWHLIAPALRPPLGRRLAPVRSASRAIEQNIEVRINRRFKRQGHSYRRHIAFSSTIDKLSNVFDIARDLIIGYRTEE
jgi:hypothetical protein